jgi:hypothetical protein
MTVIVSSVRCNLSGRPACSPQSHRSAAGDPFPAIALGKSPASCGLAEQNPTKWLSSRRIEYVNSVADRAEAAVSITSLFVRPGTFSAGRST